MPCKLLVHMFIFFLLLTCRDFADKSSPRSCRFAGAKNVFKYNPVVLFKRRILFKILRKKSSLKNCFIKNKVKFPVGL